MVDMPKVGGQALVEADDQSATVVAHPADDGAGPRTVDDADAEVVPLLEERLAVSKRCRPTGRVRISTRTEVIETAAEVELDRYRVEVTHVPIGRIVDNMPLARAEGDTTVLPVVEERLIVVKQLFLVEELRIRHVVERRAVSERVSLRRQRAFVERLEASDGTGANEAMSEKKAANGAGGGRDGFIG